MILWALTLAAFLRVQIIGVLALCYEVLILVNPCNIGVLAHTFFLCATPNGSRLFPEEDSL